jgi:hypothetical protein
MDQIECTTAERDMLHYWRFPPRPPGATENGGPPPHESRTEACGQLAPVRHCQNNLLPLPPHEYRAGGITKLTAVPLHQRQSRLADSRSRIAADWRTRPPASVAEAATRSAQRTGLERWPTQGRHF